MRTTKSVPVTVRLDARTWKTIEAQAAEDRRPVSQFLRLVIADAVAAKSGEQPKAAA